AATAPRPDLAREYTQVPRSLPDVVRKTAKDVTAGAGNDYERAVALQDWFAYDGGFRYDTTVTSGTGSAAIERFLRDREGFCVHFSFTMAAMARTLGIPARVAVGFTPGT
ncbi:MAG TPA: transglutaminase, partial [Streptomyces sp.]|nr:transglutaminase [Streptomyces sp.]